MILSPFGVALANALLKIILLRLFPLAFPLLQG